MKTGSIVSTMAWAQSALTNSSSLLFSVPSKDAAIAPRISVSASQSRSKRRKNYLRTKILKTLKKPQSSPPPLHHELAETPANSIEETLEIVREEELAVSSNGDSDEFFGDFHVLESTEKGVVGADKVITTRSVVELVLYFVGLFVVQTVCTVAFVMWSSSGVVNKAGDGEGDVELGVLGDGMVGERKKEGFWFGEDGLSRVLGGKLDSGGVDEGQMREKIAEIRAMARAARESEVKSLSDNGSVSSADRIGVDGSGMVGRSGVSKMKTNVEIEIDQRLSKVEKKLQSLAEKSSSTSVNYTVKDRDGKVSERNEANVRDEKTVFKKKLKFKSPSVKLNNKTKGFGNVNGGTKINGKGKSASKASNYSVGTNARDSLGLSDQKLKGNCVSNDNSDSSVTVKEEESRQLVEDGGKRPLNRSLEEGKTNKHVLVDGWSSSKDLEKNDDEEGKSSVKVSAMSSGTSNSKSSGIQETCLEVAEPKCSRELGEEDKSEVANNARSERSDAPNDLWWMNLPYAFAILLRNGSDQEGPRGLYSLKMNEGSLSYIVSFEDQNDATNFCYILETFFEDLGDIRADVIPLTIKELNDAMNSNAMKIMVVRKGQLKLYAGQPLTDIETTLRSLIK